MSEIKHISVIGDKLVCVSWKNLNEVWVDKVKNTCPALVDKLISEWRGRDEILFGSIEWCNCQNI